MKDTRWATFDGALSKPEFLDYGYGDGPKEPSRFLSSQRRRFRGGQGGLQDTRPRSLEPSADASAQGGGQGGVKPSMTQPAFKSQGKDFKGGLFSKPALDTAPIQRDQVAKLGGERRAGRALAGPYKSRGNNLGRGKGGTFGPLQHLGGDADPHRRGTAGQPRDTSHRVRHGAGFNTSSKKGGLFGTFEYMADGGPDSWKEAQGGASARRRGARSKPHLADKHAKGTFGAFPAHMSDPYQDRPAHPGKGAKGAIYTFTVHYHRSARPNTSGAGRVRGRTTAQMGEYTRTRVRSGRPLHTTTSLGHSSAR